MEVNSTKVAETLHSLAREGIFDELYAHLQWSRKYSGYARQETLAGRFRELTSEVSEVQEALESGDKENLAEELGDALWDLLFLFMHIAGSQT